VPYPTDREPDRPWVMRTYAGHSSATGVQPCTGATWPRGRLVCPWAFDLPTQTGYDPDDELAKARWARLAYRSATWATCASCSTASRWPRRTPR